MYHIISSSIATAGESCLVIDHSSLVPTLIVLTVVASSSLHVFCVHAELVRAGRALFFCLAPAGIVVGAIRRLVKIPEYACVIARRVVHACKCAASNMPVLRAYVDGRVRVCVYVRIVAKMCCTFVSSLVLCPARKEVPLLLSSDYKTKCLRGPLKPNVSVG